MSLGKPPLYATGSATVQRVFGTTMGSAAESRLAVSIAISRFMTSRRPGQPKV